MNSLFCKICISKLVQPKLCPHCSQIFCKSCITAYLAEKHFCPTCDNYIIDLIDCSRLVQQVQQVFNAKNSQLFNSKVCKQHGLELAYFCRDCELWICSDCGVIGDKHRAHRILNKQEAHTCNKEHLKFQITKINEKLLNMIKNKEKCALDLQVYKAQLKWSKARIQKYYEQLIAKIDTEGNRQIGELMTKMKQYEQIVIEIRNRKNQIQKMLDQEHRASQKINQYSKNHNSFNPQKSQLISLIPARYMLTQIQEDSIFLDRFMKIETIEQVFPTFVTFTYEFDYQALKHDIFHYSDYFQLWGQDWRLKIYPNGNSAVSGKFLSVFLELADAHKEQRPKNYVYRIQLLSLNKAGSTIVKQYCSMFGGGESWGYSDYLNLLHLNQYLHEGKLLFSVGVRNETYHGQCIDLKRYIKKIENENKVLQKLLCEGSSSQYISHAQDSKNLRLSQSDFEFEHSQINIDQISSDMQPSLSNT